MKTFLSLFTAFVITIMLSGEAWAYGCCRSSYGSNSWGGSFSHSSSSSWGGGSWNHSGSGSYTSASGNSYSASHSSSGNYYGGTGYAGCCGGGFHAGYVSTPYGSVGRVGYSIAAGKASLDAPY